MLFGFSKLAGFALVAESELVRDLFEEVEEAWHFGGVIRGKGGGELSRASILR